MTDYLHGYTTSEQSRLIHQAEHWRNSLILPAVAHYRPLDRLLDVGCGVGAVLGVIGTAFRGLHVAGIDREPRQIEAARTHLASLGFPNADLRTGDAAAMPWPDASFDHAYMMWFLEHLSDPAPVLRETLRVLRPGGSITIHETEYTTFRTWPPSDDWDHLAEAQREHFRRHGDASVGLRLAELLAAAGFTHVHAQALGFHFTTADDARALRAHIDYIAGFLAPAIPALAQLGFDESRMTRGLDHLRALPNLPDGAIAHFVFRATAERPLG